MDFNTLKQKLQKKYSTKFQDQFSEEIWQTTYKDYNDKTIDDTLFRVAKTIASAEETEEKRIEWTEKFYDMLSEFKVTAGGRIYANAGTEWKGTTFINCFVAPRANNDIDSLSNIIKTLNDQAQTLKSEGGWGENFSWIRPRGAFIYGIGVETPGAVKYMELFDKSSDIITSGSGKKSTHVKAKGKIRKGAMMAVLDVWHPDIIEFITAKQSSGRLTKFNMSVNCSDEFMSKVIKALELQKQIDSLSDDDENKQILIKEKEEIDKWNLRFPDTSHPKYKKEWKGDIKQWESAGYPTIVYQTVSATWLWNLIMESTYNRAEPGVLFLDRANYFNPLNYAETIYSTNPCLTGDTLVTTDKGEISFFELAKRFKSGESFKVLTMNIDTQNTEFEDITFVDKTRNNANVIELELEDSTVIKLTPDHKVYTENRGYVNASDLTTDDILIGI
jgi:ribonucleoside-diphosphate reductase alpha chain